MIELQDASGFVGAGLWFEWDRFKGIIRLNYHMEPLDKACFMRKESVWNVPCIK